MWRIVSAAVSLGLIPSVLAVAAPDVERTARRVDQLLQEEVHNGSVELAPPASDATWLRRVWLDVVGDIPSPEHVTAFVLDPDPQKRAKVVADLVNDPQYGQNWARYWRDVILYRRVEERATLASDTVTAWLTDELNSGRGWDDIATACLTSSGDVRENGATAITFAQDGRTEEATAEFARIFLGIQIQCAQCHDHPWDRWQREEFHELAAFFPRVGLRPINTATKRSFAVIVNDNPRMRRMGDNANQTGKPEHYMPDLEHPDQPGTQMQPKFFLTGAELPLGTPDADRRERAAAEIVGSEWFATAYVNRLWAELVGEGFYEVIDDIGPDREPSAPQTVAYLSAQFAESGYDTKWLTRVITTTEAYGRECRARRLPDAVPFTANVAQPLRADQIFNALLSALEFSEEEQNPFGGSTNNRGGGYRGGNRPRDVFNTVFGYDPSVPRTSVVTSIPQSLAMMNTPQLNQALTAGNNRKPTPLGKLLAEIPDDAELVTELYLRTLCREPTDTELADALTYAQSVGKRNEAAEDLLWSLVNGAEFSHRR